MNKLQTLRKAVIALCFSIIYFDTLMAQFEDLGTVPAKIDFSHQLREWDGFGVNYIQTAHTRDYEEFPQDYGGFSILNQEQKEAIIDMVFGENGLKPGIVKMFLDPLHQEIPGGAYDHQTTTKYLLEFFDMGWEKTKEWGGDLSIITTLYGPPAYVTRQKTIRGRDIDPDHKKDLALYMIEWAKYLKNKGYPVKYISLHNEGEDWRRWPVAGNYANFDHGHDYNLYWRPEEVADFLEFMPGMMSEQGIGDVGLTPGECSRWFQFYYSGYARSILENSKALDNLSLLTSHNFYRTTPGGHRWFAGTSNIGTDMIRQEKPGLHAWVTSASWADMDADFAWQIWMNIYLAKVNAYIPWAIIERPEHWISKDPNPNTAFVVSEDGTYEVKEGYYLYKHFSPVGQPGMGIAYTECRDSEIQLLGFAKNNTPNPDAFVVINVNNWVPNRADAVDIIINNASYTFSNQDPLFHTYREENQKEKYRDIIAKSVRTEKGYLLEVSFPLKKLNILPTTGIPMNIEFRIKDGAYALAGELRWLEGGPFVLSSGYDSYEYSIHYNPLKTDTTGIIEADWERTKEYIITEKIHPNTKEGFGAKWEACYDSENLYFLIDITDDTNLQARRVKINLNGTDFSTFKAIRSVDKTESYNDIGIYKVVDGSIIYDAPSRSVTTFIGIE
jgi:O-glycosyl hydrolase